MPVTNWIVVLATGLIPLLVGFLWYGPLFGKTWMKVADMDEEKNERWKHGRYICHHTYFWSDACFFSQQHCHSPNGLVFFVANA